MHGCGPQYMQAIKMGEEGQEGEMGLDVKTNGISPNLIKDCFMIHWFYINHFFIHQFNDSKKPFSKLHWCFYQTKKKERNKRLEPNLVNQFAL